MPFTDFFGDSVAWGKLNMGFVILFLLLFLTRKKLFKKGSQMFLQCLCSLD